MAADEPEPAPDDQDDLGVGGVWPEWWTLSSLLSPEAQALAALVLGGLSLISISAAGAIVTSLEFHHHSPKVLSIVPGVHALVGLVGFLLAVGSIRAGWDEETTWASGVSRAAIVVCAVSLVLNVVAFGFAVTASEPGSFGFPVPR